MLEIESQNHINDIT